MGLRSVRQWLRLRRVATELFSSQSRIRPLRAAPPAPEESSSAMVPFVGLAETGVVENGLTENLATLALKPDQSTQLDDLPEELLDKVALYLIPDIFNTSIAAYRDLANASLISRKFHRIVEPYLYRTILITFNKRERRLALQLECQNGDTMNCAFDIPTTKGANAAVFLRTMKARPDLAQYVKNLWISRRDWGFRARKMLGIYGLEPGSTEKLSMADLERAAEAKTPLPYSIWNSAQANALNPTRSMDPVSELVRDVLRVLPNVTFLSRMDYITDAPWDPFFELVGGLGTLPLESRDFSNLYDLRMACTGMHLGDLWPVFTLPALRLLFLHGGVVAPANDAQISRWEGACTTRVKFILLDNPAIHYHQPNMHNPLYLMSAACTELQALQFFTTGRASLASGMMVSLLAFALRFNTLRSVAIFDTQAQSFIPGALAAVWLGNTFHGEFQHATNLQSLDVNVIDLLSVFPAGEIPLNTKGLLQQAVTFESLPGRRYRALLDLTLPPSLVSLKLRIGAEQVQQDAVIDALEGLVDSVRQRFPVLREIKLFWHESDAYPCLKEQPLVERFRKHGVELVSEYLRGPLVVR